MAENAPERAFGSDRAFWPSFAAGLRGKVPPTVMPYLNKEEKVTGVWKNGLLTLWVDSEFTRSMLNKPAVLDGLRQAAAATFGGEPQVSVVTGKPPVEEQTPPAPVPDQPPAEASDALDELIAFGEQFDNIVIQ
jgi:DNA polymerase-3 subunit gamma/tau